MNVRSVRGLTAFESIKNDDFKNHLTDIHEWFSTLVPKIIDGDKEALKLIVKEHISGKHLLCTLRSRFVYNISTTTRGGKFTDSKLLEGGDASLREN